MKNIVLAALTFLILTAGYAHAEIPKEYVNDKANILTLEQKTFLNNIISDFQVKTGNELAVLILPELVNETIESQAVKTFEEWGIGKKGTDNGVLLLVSLKERQMRIEVGYGLEGTLTDLRSNLIIRDTIAPEFKNQNYFQGIEKGLRSIISAVSENSPEQISKESEFQISEGLISFFAFLGYFLFTIIARTKSWWLGGVIGAVLGAWFGSIASIATFAIIGLIIDFILSKLGQNPHFVNTLHAFGSMSSRGRSGGGSGFGGFGGGRSGGGGSSGSW